MADLVGLGAHRIRHARAENGVDVAVGQHIGQRFVGRVGGDLDWFQKLRRGGWVAMGADLFDRALNPLNAGQIDAVFVFEIAANPDRRGLGIMRRTDPLAGEILWLLDAGIAVHADERVAECL